MQLQDELYYKDRIASLSERIDLFQRELKHGKLMCAHLGFDLVDCSFHDEFYFKSVLHYLNALNLYLEKLYEDVCFVRKKAIQETFESLWSMIETGFFSLPPAFHSLLVSATQRRFRPIRHIAGRSFPTYSFAEAHPTYSTEIYILEKINLHFYLKLERIYHNFALPMIPCISDRNEYAFFINEEKKINHTDSVPRYLVDINSLCKNYAGKPGPFKEKASIYFALSLVYLPRWSPTRLRYAVFMAHEEFHRLILLINKCRLLITNSIYTKNSLLSERKKIPQELGKHYARLLGKGLYELSRIYDDIYTSFEKRVVNYLYRKPYFEKSQYKQYKETAIRQLYELMCDLGAICLCGPAYLSAFLSAFYSKDIRDETRIFDFLHPPDLVRIYLMLNVLRECGFTFSGSSQIKDWPEFVKSRSNKSYGMYYRWIRKNHSHFKKFVHTLLHYSNIKDPAALEESARTIYKNIKEGEVFFSQCDPVEILNALWLKRRESPSDLGLHILWRSALRYCGPH